MVAAALLAFVVLIQLAYAFELIFLGLEPDDLLLPIDGAQVFHVVGSFHLQIPHSVDTGLVGFALTSP